MKPVRATTTLGDLQRVTPWLWLNCERRQHYAPLACAVAVNRWGRDASSDVLRQRARCTAFASVQQALPSRRPSEPWREAEAIRFRIIQQKSFEFGC
jgi:hypothetical protein